MATEQIVQMTIHFFVLTGLTGVVMAIILPLMNMNELAGAIL